jgi:plasmid stability protein
MKEVILHLPDQTYERLRAEAASAHTSLEQWILDKLSTATGPKASVPEAHMLLAAAMDGLGFKRLQPEKAQQLSELLAVRKVRSLSNGETTELNTLLAEAEALELASFERLATALGR